MKSVLETRPALKAVMDQIAEVSGYLWEKGWAERNGGNLSYNITDLVDDEMKAMPAISPVYHIGEVLPNLKGCWFYTKGTLKRMRDLSRDPMANGSIIRILDDCETYEIVADCPVVPTSELPSHLSIQDFLIGSGSSYKATLHTHPIELVAMSHIRKFCSSEVLTGILLSMIPETLAFAPLGLGFIPFGIPGSLGLAQATLEGIRKHDVILWEKHGTVAVGLDMIEAFDQTDVLNKAACIYKTSCELGSVPEGMADNDIRQIREIFHLPSERNQ